MMCWKSICLGLWGEGGHFCCLPRAPIDLNPALSTRSPDYYLCKMQWLPMKIIVWCHSQQISGKQGHCTKFTPLLTRQHTEPDQATLIHWRCLGPQGWSASTSSYKWTAMATRLIGGHNTFRMKYMKSQKNVYFSWDCQVTELKCFHVLAL